MASYKMEGSLGLEGEAYRLEQEVVEACRWEQEVGEACRLVVLALVCRLEQEGACRLVVLACRLGPEEA